MSSPSVFRNREISGPEKVAVSKSTSLQEMTGSLRDISEDESGEGAHSSGVFSCSVDISDVCMADLTKLTDSTLPRNDVVMSTPLTVKTPMTLVGEFPLTPVSSQGDFLSPQFGASDDYLRRNIKFIHKQLGSLKIQLISEDKYFQTCSQKYEDVIADLESQITALKSKGTSDRLSRLIEETEEKSHQLSQVQNELDLANKRLAEFNDNPLNRQKNVTIESTQFVPQLLSLLESARIVLKHDKIDTFLRTVDSDKTDLKTVDECFKYLKEVVDAYQGLSSLTTTVWNKGLPKQLTTEQTSEADSEPKDKIAEKVREIESLRCQIEESRAVNVDVGAEAAELRAKNKKLEAELIETRQQRTKSSDQIVAGVEERVRLEKRNVALEAKVKQLTSELANAVDALSRRQQDFDALSREFDSSRSSTNVENYQRDTEFSAVTVKLSSATRSLTQAQVANDELKLEMTSKDEEIMWAQEAQKRLETEHKAMIEEFRIKGSSLILENSKLKDELNALHKALDDAQRSAVKSNDKFEELQNLYSSLNYRMESKEAAFAALEAEKTKLEAAAREKTAVLGRLCANFNELLAIFRECQGLGLDSRSTATDVDDGFIKLKRRLLDLSQDYIALNNTIKTLEAGAAIAAAKFKEKETEVSGVRRKCEAKCANLTRTLEKVEAENKQLVAEKIEQDSVVRRLTTKMRDFELQEQLSKGCADCGLLRSQLQQLQISLVDKDSAISTLELHIQTCCEYNRKKAQQYKHERFKIRELEDKVVKLEKEKTVLKRLCKIRSDRIHELESSQESRSLSSTRSPK